MQIFNQLGLEQQSEYCIGLCNCKSPIEVCLRHVVLQDYAHETITLVIIEASAVPIC